MTKLLLTRYFSVGIGAVLLLAGLLTAAPAAAQSGPYGNEWIVPSQPYFKIKVTRTAIYKMDYQYLTRAGIPAGLNPSLLQLWRRGRQVAIYQGGNATALDPTTFYEFYGQRNDGVLDADYYKNPADQPHQLLGYATDTAAYFITYGVGAGAVPGRRMATPVAAGGTPHPYRLLNIVKIEANHAVDVAVNSTYLPWLEKGEGFYTRSGFLLGYSPLGNIATSIDTVLRGIMPAPAPRVELLLLGGTQTPGSVTPGPAHTVAVRVANAGSPARPLGISPPFVDFDFVRAQFPLLRTDIAANGRINLVLTTPAGSPNINEYYRLGYQRLIVPQANRWFTNRRFLLFQNDSTLGGGPATFEVDSIPATVQGYDVQDPWNVQRVAPTAAATLGALGRRFVFPSATGQQTRRLALYDAARALVPLPARRLTFRAIDPAQPNYVIVTHPKLMRPATGTANAALAYAAYRHSPAGGGYDTLMVTAHQLYDQFHYGERSVLALRHFARWLVANTPPTRRPALLLLGKAIQPGVAVEFPARVYGVTRSLGEIGQDLVPCTTRSVSDTWLSSDFRNNDYAGQLPTGRVVAGTPQMVMDYLAKVQAHESAGPAPWRKNALTMAGGESTSDFAEFGGYVAGYNQLIAKPCFGGRVVRSVARNTAIVGGVNTYLSVNIASELNAGLSLITYFGHGSNTVFDVEIGDVNDPSSNYNNVGKYPVLFYNGCAAANLFGQYAITGEIRTFGENWLMSPNRGALGLMGQTGSAYAQPLDQAQTEMYRTLLNEKAWYGRPIAEVRNEVSRRLQADPNFIGQGNIAAEQLLCTLWQGDPAIKLYAPALPDFQTSNAQLSIEPATGQTSVSASSPTFRLNVGVANPGSFCTRTDSLEIRVTRRFGSARANEAVTQMFKVLNGADAVYALDLRNTIVNGLNVFGNNTFVVELNPRRREAELDYTNNTAQISFNFLQGGLTLLSPAEFALVPAAPRLSVQTNDPNGPLRGFDFEADTVPTFSSAVRLQLLNVQANLLASWRPALPTFAGRDSVVWYWRAKLSLPVGDEDPNWTVSSFRVAAGAPGGWSQSHHGQFRRDARRGVEVSVPGGRWAFGPLRQPLQLRTVGGGPARPAGTFPAPTFQSVIGTGILSNLGNAVSYVGCGIASPNLLAVAYDQRTLRPIAVAAAPGISYSQCGQNNVDGQAFYYFGSEASAFPFDSTDNLNNFSTPNGLGALRHRQLQAWLNNVPVGAYVALVSVNRLRYAAWPAATRRAIANLLGSTLINTLTNGDPLVLLAQKRSSGPGFTREVGPNPALPTPRFLQVVSLNDTLQTASTRGQVTSTRIGPAQQWETLFTHIAQGSATSSYTLNVRGIDSTGTVGTQVLRSAVVGGRQGYSLAGISARTYPYLQLELTLTDSLNRQSPQLKQWVVTYRGLPEGVVRRDLVAAAAYDPAALAAQAVDQGSIRFPVKFTNVSTTDFGTPMKALVELRDATQSNRVVRSLVLSAPQVLRADSTLTLDVRLNVTGLFGRFTPSVVFNPLVGSNAAITSTLPERFFFNNEITLPPFTVVDGNVPPVLDVAFDGRHILNGELVSPTPEIRVQVQDEDRLRRIRDVNAFNLTLQRPGQPLGAAVVLTGNDVTFSVDSTSVTGSKATLVYLPGKNTPLTDGMYTLRAQARDRSTAAAGSQDFEVKFEVVNASTISNVFPYPNPVTSKARFVFTVTGQELPRDMKIQIMTLTGAVVREIFLAELGPLHIGHNLTDFAWDGTDQYGDRLANGTYLYRVSLNDPAGQFAQRATAGDKAFKNDWGKLVLLR